MNKRRRSEIDTLIEELNDLKNRVASVLEDEQGSLENMPESLQGSDRGYAMQEGIDELDSASNSLSDAVDALEAAKG